MTTSTVIVGSLISEVVFGGGRGFGGAVTALGAGGAAVLPGKEVAGGALEALPLVSWNSFWSSSADIDLEIVEGADGAFANGAGAKGVTGAPGSS